MYGYLKQEGIPTPDKSVEIKTEEIGGCFKITVDTNGLKKLEDYMANLEQENKQLNNQLQQKENIIKEVREYITSYESISTIEGLEDIETNKDLDEKTLNEMIRRYMIVHDKVLKILDKERELN